MGAFLHTSASPRNQRLFGSVFSICASCNMGARFCTKVSGIIPCRLSFVHGKLTGRSTSKLSVHTALRRWVVQRGPCQSSQGGPLLPPGCFDIRALPTVRPERGAFGGWSCPGKEREEKERLGTGALRSGRLKTAHDPPPHGLKKSNLEVRQIKRPRRTPV
jgi:hypothetical protein